MVRWLLVLAFVSGCGSKAPPEAAPGAATTVIPDTPPTAPPELPPRARDDLTQAVSDFAAESATPPLGDPAFLVPPREAELDWINDTGAPMQDRMERALALYDDSKSIMKRYVPAAVAEGADTPESLFWSEAVIRIFGRICTVIVDEFIPTLSEQDPSYATRMNGLTKMGDGAFLMVRGSMITLNARRAPLESRRRLAAAWRMHAPRYGGLWRADRCVQLVQWVRDVVTSEKDATLRADLEAVATAFGACRGR